MIFDLIFLLIKKIDDVKRERDRVGNKLWNYEKILDSLYSYEYDNEGLKMNYSISFTFPFANFCSLFNDFFPENIFMNFNSFTVKR